MTARAIRCAGELLAEIEPAHGANQNISGSAPTNVGRTAAAVAVGMSKDQQKRAVRVANVPAASFKVCDAA